MIVLWIIGNKSVVNDACIRNSYYLNWKKKKALLLVVKLLKLGKDRLNLVLWGLLLVGSCSHSNVALNADNAHLMHNLVGPAENTHDLVPRALDSGAGTMQYVVQAAFPDNINNSGHIRGDGCSGSANLCLLIRIEGRKKK